MAPGLGNLAASRSPATAPRFPARPCGYHPLPGDGTFGARDCVCSHGVHSPRKEGVYPRPHVAVILDGAFLARSRQGSTVVGPGALLLGNARAGYEFRHLDDGGDRSIVFDYDEAALDELGGTEFRTASVPASPASVDAVTVAYHALRSGEREAVREAALVVATVAVAAQRGDPRPGTAVGGHESRRIARALRYIEAHHADDCSLDALAGVTRLTTFQLVRMFRAVTGQTPRQIVIATRLRAAARALRATRATVLEIALDAGFCDLSHFTTSFTRAFGVSPGRYRSSAG